MGQNFINIMIWVFPLSIGFKTLNIMKTLCFVISNKIAYLVNIKFIQKIANLIVANFELKQIFKEEKQLFCMEGFKVTTIKAIIRYIHLVMVAYTILFIKNLQIATIGILRKFIELYLKKKRNIKKISLSSLKIFYEKCHEFHFDFSSIFPLFLREKLGFEV